MWRLVIDNDNYGELIIKSCGRRGITKPQKRFITKNRKRNSKKAFKGTIFFWRFRLISLCMEWPTLGKAFFEWPDRGKFIFRVTSPGKVKFFCFFLYYFENIERISFGSNLFWHTVWYPPLKSLVIAHFYCWNWKGREKQLANMRKRKRLTRICSGSA